MRNSTDERGSEGIRIGNPGGSCPAIVKRIVRPETVDAQRPLFRVKLRGILSVGDASPVRFFGYPAFVADVGVTACGVQRRDDAPCFRARAISHRQPRAGGSMLLDVFGRRFNAHVRQPGALEVESAKLFAVHLEWALVPVAVDSLLRLGGFFAASAPGRQAPGLAAIPPPSRSSGISRGASGASITRVSVSRLSRALIMGIMPSFRNYSASVRQIPSHGGRAVEFVS